MPYAFAPMALVLSMIAFPQARSDVPVAEEHCVVFVVDVAESGQFKTSEPECFRTQDEASSWATLGLPLMSRVGGTNGGSSGGGTVAFSTFTLGTHYDGFNGTGSSISVVGSSCTGGYWNTTPSWDNRISSSYNGCALLRHYDFPNKGGSGENTYGAGTTDNLGLLNNKSESISYHSS
jgi:hypothetical protein